MEIQCESKNSIPTSPRTMNYSFKQQSSVLKNIEKLLYDQARLELLTPTFPLNEALVNFYRELSMQLRLQLRKVARSRWDPSCQGEQITMMQDRIKSILHKMRKLTEINIYFQELRKQQSELQMDVQKFLFYIAKEDGLQKKLQQFLTEPTVSELVFKEYEKSYNPNNFVADLIQFFDFQARNKLIDIPKERECAWIRNSDLLLIENSTIIFRQICQISDKYTLVEEQLKQAYIHLDFVKGPAVKEASKDLKYKQQTDAVEVKMKQLALIAHKIKRHAGNLDLLMANQDTIVLSEEPEIFEALSREFDYSLKVRNQTFFAFLQELYEGKQALQIVSEGKFNFIRQKIIKTEMRWHLNRLFSALNVGSHVASKINDNIVPKPKHYTFAPPSLLINYELNAKRMSFFSERDSDQLELELLSKNIQIVHKEQGFVLQMQRSKAVYPSALHSYYYLLKYLLCLSTILQETKHYNDQLLLEITSIKADEMMQWADTVINLYQMIKKKFQNCQKMLFEYLLLIFKVHWLEQLDYVKRELKEGDDIQKILAFYTEKEKKARWVNQIIFELDTTFDIEEPFQKIIEIEQRHYRTSHCSDHHHFYELILNEVIETRNNLKFDRSYSFNGLHQLFSFPSAKPSNLKDLAAQLAPLSKTHMRLPDLLRFYSCQNRIKREVFKAEVYWTSFVNSSVKNKFIFTNQKKKVCFKDFLQQNAKFLMNMIDKSLEYFLNNLQEIERAVLLFSHEVDRLKLIQSSLVLLSPDFPLEDHIAAFNHRELNGFFIFCSSFNLVEDIYLRRDKINWVLNQIKKMISQSKLRFNQLNMDSCIVSLKNFFAGLIFIIYSFGQHYTSEDCLSLKQEVIDMGKAPEEHLKLQVWRSKRDILKEYEECQFLDWQTLVELVQIYELLIHVTINRIVARADVPQEDKTIFTYFLKDLPTYQSFKALEDLEDLQKTKYFSSNTSKSHSLSCLKCIIELHKQKCQNFKGYKGIWPSIEYIFMLPEIGIVSRRLFCNELIQLKHEVSGEEWKYFNKQNCLNKLRLVFNKTFIDRINCFLLEELANNEILNPNCTLTQNLSHLGDICRQQIIEEFDNRFAVELQQARNIVLFDEDRGVEVDKGEEENFQETQKSQSKKNRCRFKRGLLNAVKMQDSSAAALASSLQQKVNLQIVKQSLPIRKKIYHMQLQQKRIKDEIAWQTCKLQHTVISKINTFIEQSNQDQRQSLINFKYTVSLQTIKGIENVIHERTEILNKNQEEEAEGFITQPHSRKQLETKEEQSLLDINIRNVFNHLQKIKVFWAWKKMHMSKRCGEDEWAKFSVNAERILYNKDNNVKMKNIEELREKCSKQEILCNLIKEENSQLNSSIKSVKISRLNSKLREFKQKHQIEEGDQGDESMEREIQFKELQA